MTKNQTFLPTAAFVLQRRATTCENPKLRSQDYLRFHFAPLRKPRMPRRRLIMQIGSNLVRLPCAVAIMVVAPVLVDAQGTASKGNAPFTVHVYTSGASGIFANAYLIETKHGIVAVDSTLSVSDSRAFRAKLDALHKPLLAVLLTHGHPDHYNGVTTLIAGATVPVVATAGVDKVIREYDAA
jgi:hypothetical protein